MGGGDDLGQGRRGGRYGERDLALAGVRAPQPVPLPPEAGEGVLQLGLIRLQLLELLQELLD